ncbi:MAG: methyltransferase domain-containing protein [Bacteriovoracaceae bacterium]|nr:methyltransferase domain-containing protein [Bacteriovoracaceae bacterium]
MQTTQTSSKPEFNPSKWEAPPCPFCGSTSFRGHEKYGANHRFTYVKCNDCTLVYQNPRPFYDTNFTAFAYDSYFVTKHYHVQHPGQFNEKELKLIEDNKNIMRNLEKLLGRKGRMLEIGSCTGLLLLAAKQLGWDCFGIDISAPMVKFMVDTYGIPGVAGQYDQLTQIKNEKFDLIYCSHVIEHIPNPNEWMECFKKNLAPNGIVFIQVPNQYAPDRVLKRVAKDLGLKKDKWHPSRTPDHLYEPHISSMKYLIHKHGGKIIFLETYSRDDMCNKNVISKIRHNVLKWGNNLRVAFKFSDNSMT